MIQPYSSPDQNTDKGSFISKFCKFMNALVPEDTTTRQNTRPILQYNDREKSQQ